MKRRLGNTLFGSHSYALQSLLVTRVLGKGAPPNSLRRPARFPISTPTPHSQFATTSHHLHHPRCPQTFIMAYSGSSRHIDMSKLRFPRKLCWGRRNAQLTTRPTLGSQQVRVGHCHEHQESYKYRSDIPLNPLKIHTAQIADAERIDTEETAPKRTLRTPPPPPLRERPACPPTADNDSC